MFWTNAPTAQIQRDPSFSHDAMTLSQFCWVIFAYVLFGLSNWLIYQTVGVQRRLGNGHLRSNRLFESGRGIFSFLVFAGHAVLAVNLLAGRGVFWPPPIGEQQVDYLAAVGVDVFFFITGALFWQRVQCGSGFDGRFLAKRLVRLLPAMLGVTLVILAVCWIAGAKVSASFALVNWLVPIWPSENGLRDLLFGHYWSLRDEWFYYVFLCGAAPYLGKHRWILLGVFSVAILLDRMLVMIVCGCLSVEAVRWPAFRKLLGLKQIAWAVALVFIAYIVISMHSWSPAIKYPVRVSMVFAFGSVMIVHGASSSSPQGWRRINEIAAVSGLPSYSVYLLHGGILAAVVWTLRELGVSGHTMFPWVLCVGGLVLSIASWVSFFLFELPYVSGIWSRTKKPRRIPVVAEQLK